uniref:Retrovirus-related Pol polyprotein from transposon TNT 1-94 n=1 Tax=Tanacetum cinerariifolium TaxID=118510 RepID=A0A6L2NY34_TANCI|nr:hypothetical protein [Tanacetum cinerariifolium]
MENLNEVRVKELRSDNETKDHLGKFDENADYGYFLGYSLAAKSFRGDEINFNEDRSFFDDEFLVSRSKVSQSSGKDDYFPYVLTYVPLSINNITIPDPVIPIDTPTLQDNNSIDESPEFSLANDHPIHNKRDNFEPADVHSDSFVSQDITINEPITKVEPSPIIISLLAEVFNHPPVPQDKWSREKHIKLPMNAYAHFLSEIGPKKLIQALKDEGWIISMHKDLNQFKSNKALISKHILTQIILDVTYIGRVPQGVVKYLVERDAYKNDKLKTFKPYQISATSFKTPYASEFPLTSHMMKVAKLLPKPQETLILPFGGVNAKNTADKSLFGTSLQLVSQPKAPIDKKSKKKKNPPSSKPKTSKIVRESSPIKQVTKTQHAKKSVATTNTTKRIESSESVEDLRNQTKPADAK